MCSVPGIVAQLSPVEHGVDDIDLLARRVKRGRIVIDPGVFDVSSHTIRADHRSGQYRSRSGPHFTFRVTWGNQEPSNVPDIDLLARRVKRGRIVIDPGVFDVSSHTIRVDHRSGQYRSRSGPHFTFRVTWGNQEPSKVDDIDLLARRVKRGRILIDPDHFDVSSHTIRADHRSGQYRSRSGPHFTFRVTWETKSYATHRCRGIFARDALVERNDPLRWNGGTSVSRFANQSSRRAWSGTSSGLAMRCRAGSSFPSPSKSPTTI